MKYSRKKSHCKDIEGLDRDKRPDNMYKLLYAFERDRNKSLNDDLKKKNQEMREKEKKHKEEIKKLKDELETEQAKAKTSKANCRPRNLHWKKQYHTVHAEKSIVEKQLNKVTAKRYTEKLIKKGTKDFLATTKLTPAQQKMLMNPDQKWAKNTDQDICQALVIRCISSKAFETLRKEKKLYYPSRHTIERHLDGMLHCKPG